LAPKFLGTKEAKKKTLSASFLLSILHKNTKNKPCSCCHFCLWLQTWHIHVKNASLHPLFICFTSYKEMNAYTNCFVTRKSHRMITLVSYFATASLSQNNTMLYFITSKRKPTKTHLKLPNLAWFVTLYVLSLPSIYNYKSTLFTPKIDDRRTYNRCCPSCHKNSHHFFFMVVTTQPIYHIL